MIIINFFDCSSLLIGLSKLYGLDENTILRLNIEAIGEENPTASFIKAAGIKLDSIDVRQVMLHCKHIMTVDDEFDSLKKYGLMTLDKVLELDTPLHRFLKEHQIEVDVKKRSIFYKEKKILLIDSEQECQECYYGGDCKHKTWLDGSENTLSYKDMVCKYRKSISIFRTKLYVHKSEIEVHLSGKRKDVHEYSRVRYYPEIIETLENMIFGIFGESPQLKEDWEKRQGGKYYCLDFDVNIFDFERIVNRPYFEDYESFFEFNEKPMYDLYSASPNFFANIYILKWALEILLGEKPNIYGQLLPHVNIPFEDIGIEEYQVSS